VSAEMEPRVIEGRVITNGVAQSVTREDGVTRVRLTVFGALAPRLDYEAMAASGAMTPIPLAEPVTVEAGETVVMEVEWHPGPVRSQGAFQSLSGMTIRQAIC
jgi:hypothetical protein